MCFGVREWSCTRPNFLFVCFQCDMCVWERGACVTGQACDCTREPQESYVYDVARGSYIGVLRQGACFLSCDVEVRYLFPLCVAQGAGEEGGDAVAQGSVEDLVEVPLLGFPVGRVVKGPPGRESPCGRRIPRGSTFVRRTCLRGACPWRIRIVPWRCRRGTRPCVRCERVVVAILCVAIIAGSCRRVVPRIGGDLPGRLAWVFGRRVP